jgi:hypothetical protein
VPEVKARLRRLSGFLAVETQAKSKCFKDFRGRQPLVEECLDAITRVGNHVVEFEMPFAEAADIVSKDCLKIKNEGHQTACISGAAAAYQKSYGQPATLDGRRRKKSRR